MVNIKKLTQRSVLCVRFNSIYNYTRVRDKKRLVKVGNLVKNSYLYR